MSSESYAIETRKIGLGTSALFIAIQIVFARFVAEGWVPIALVAGLLLAVLMSLTGVRLPKGTQGIVLALIALALLSAFGLRWLMARDLQRLFMLFASFLILAQCVQLTGTRDKPDENVLPGLGVLTMAMLVMTDQATLAPWMLHASILVFCISLFLTMRPDVLTLTFSAVGRRQGLMTCGVFASALFAGGLIEQELQHDLPMVQAAMAKWRGVEGLAGRVVGSEARFVRTAGLSSIVTAQTVNPNQVVFTVVSRTPPGYMRTMVFSQFRGEIWRNGRNLPSDQWSPKPARLPEEFDSEHLSSLRQSTLFQLKEGRSVTREHLVTVPSGRGDLVPTTLTSRFLAGEGMNLPVNAHTAVVPGHLENNRYLLLDSERVAPRAEPLGYLESLMEVPQADRDFFHQYSQEVCGSDNSTAEKIFRLEKYFSDNFSYDLSATPEANLRGRTKVRAFLEDRREAHCEYFATAATLLLRSQGVPCRLVIGYLAFDMDDAEERYVARNKNAHAWVEAYDQDLQVWSIVEPTPGFAGLRESMRQFQQTAATVSATDQTGMQGLGYQAYQLLRLVWEWGLAMLFSRLTMISAVGIISVWWIRSYIYAQDATICSRVVRKADRLARRFGYRRRPSETCDQFASRLEEADLRLNPLAKWYRDFASCRYQTQVANEMAQSSLALPKYRDLVRG